MDCIILSISSGFSPSPSNACLVPQVGQIHNCFSCF